MKPLAVYHDVLRFEQPVLDTLAERFELARFEVPGSESAEARQRAEVLFAPLGYAVDGSRFDLFPKLKVVASSTLKTPHIDRDEATKRGVAVVCLEGERELLNSISATAELCWGMVIALTRLVPWSVRDAKAGNWRGRHWGAKTPHMLSRMRLGVVGLGRLGRMVAGYGLAFGMEVAAVSPRSTMDGVKIVHSLNDLAKWADIVSMHANHTPETEKMCGAQFFAAMKPGAYFVNTARGELVDETALLAALQSGHLGGAALDVYDGVHQPGFSEGIGAHPLVEYARTHENLLLTPYFAGATRDAWAATQQRTVDLLIAAYDAGGAG